MKKLGIVLLTLIMVVSTAGCQGKDNRRSNTPLDAVKTNLDKLSQKDLSKVYADSDDMAYQVDKEFVSRMNAFAWDVFMELQKEGEENVFISPYSISSALTMLYNGADGNTKEEMTKALNYENMSINDINDAYQKLMISLMRADANVKLDVANSIWIEKGFSPEEAFVETIKEYYFSEVFNKDFSDTKTVGEINGWISNATNKMIEKMLEKIDPDAVMYLINAIYFKGDWTKPFDENATKQEAFDMLNGSVDVEMMHQFEKLKFYNGESLLGVELPYGRKRLSMYAFVPREENQTIDELLAELEVNDFEKIFYEFNEFSNVEVKLPKFKVEYGIKELQPVLENLGMVDIFTDAANLSGIGKKLFVSSVGHKAVIDVNEKGSEAAAVTTIEVTLTSMPIYDETINPVFIADQPFFFVIRDNYTGTILFMGKIGDLR